MKGQVRDEIFKEVCSFDQEEIELIMNEEMSPKTILKGLRRKLNDTKTQGYIFGEIFEELCSFNWERYKYERINEQTKLMRVRRKLKADSKE